MNLLFKRYEVFLSHSGRDRDRATKLAATLELKLAELGYRVEVFNTSEPEHRYKELKEVLSAGDDWLARSKEYEEKLRAYLSKHLKASTAFLSLVTPNSLAAGSKVVEFEMEVAGSMAREHQGPFFFPCVSDGASLRDLPRNAMRFQGLELDQEDGMIRLVDAVQRALSKDV
jgi:hypothetical protein